MRLDVEAIDNIFSTRFLGFYSKIEEVSQKDLQISLLQVICKSSNWYGNRDFMFQKCADFVSPLLYLNAAPLKDYQLYLFLSSGKWLPINRITTYKKLWKSEQDNLQACWFNNSDFSEEVEFFSGNTVCYAGLIRIEKDKFSESIKLAGKNSFNKFLILLKKDITFAPSTIQQLFSYAYPVGKSYKQLRIDFLNLCLNICVNHNSIMRVEAFEQETGIDIVLPLNLFKALKGSISRPIQG